MNWVATTFPVANTLVVEKAFDAYTLPVTPSIGPPAATVNPPALMNRVATTFPDANTFVVERAFEA